jgi:hypothetical protein
MKNLYKMAKKIKSYNEGELKQMFGLKRLVGNLKHPLMEELTTTSATLSLGEQYLFDIITDDLPRKIIGWNEEMLKMNFISPLLILGHILETEQYKTFYESTIEATINNQFLKVRTDMMIATGELETPEVPFFYFQEYKKVKEPKGDPTAQLIEAFLIAQEKNNIQRPLYGCTVYGREWEFYVMEARTYCISKAYNCTDNGDLMSIIAILRKFKEILETRLLLM